MNELDEIKQLEIELREKKARLQNKQTVCNHEWTEVKYDPEEIMVQYSSGGYEGSGVDIWPKTAYRKDKNDRWSRACRICGKVEYGYKKEVVNRELIFE